MPDRVDHAMKREVTEARLAVCELIRDAFAGVRLDDGVGLMQARAIDDHADAKTVRACRKEDETEDWSAIPFTKLQRYCDTLSFFDAKGMRFHLPAFMIGELERKVSPGPLYHLTQLTDWSEQKFVELSVPQRRAVRAYLMVLKDDRDYCIDRPHIESALASYWTE